MTDPRTAIDNLAAVLTELGVQIQPLTGSVAPEGDAKLTAAALRHDDAFWAYEEGRRAPAGRLAETTLKRLQS